VIANYSGRINTFILNNPKRKDFMLFHECSSGGLLRMPRELPKRSLCLLAGAAGLCTLAFTAPVAGAVTFYELSSGFVHGEYPWWVPAAALVMLAPALLASLAYLAIGRRDRSVPACAAGAFVLLASLFFLATASGAIEQNLFVITTHTPEYQSPYYSQGVSTKYFVVNRFLVNVGSYWIFECVLAIGAALMGGWHYFQAGQRTPDALSRRAGKVLFAAAALFPTFILSFAGFFLFGAGALLAAGAVTKRLRTEGDAREAAATDAGGNKDTISGLES
jgi:hypothetical protein